MGEIAQAIHKHEYKDHGGHKKEVKALKMNCVDFKPLCRQQGIDEFPTIRIYRSDGSSSSFERCNFGLGGRGCKHESKWLGEGSQGAPNWLQSTRSPCSAPNAWIFGIVCWCW